MDAMAFCVGSANSHQMLEVHSQYVFVQLWPFIYKLTPSDLGFMGAPSVHSFGFLASLCFRGFGERSCQNLFLRKKRKHLQNETLDRGRQCFFLGYANQQSSS